MLQLIPPPTEQTNEQLVRNDRLTNSDGVREGNAAWLERQLRQAPMKHGFPPTEQGEQGPAATNQGLGRDSVADPTYIVLLGGSDLVSFRLRVAQAHLRHDLWPSHWSHAVLLGPLKSTVARQRVYEVTVQPRHGFEHAVLRNGVQETTVSRYDDPAEYPNIAVLRVNVNRSDWSAETTGDGPPNVLQALQTQRAVFDGPEAILIWLAFVWGAGRTGNPLLEGTGIPSASMIEAVLNGVGFDISPGVDGRISAPEVFWQTAKWWWPFYEKNHAMRIVGRYDVASRINDVMLRLPNTRRQAPGRISGR